MKRSHWVRPGIHRSLGAPITRRVGHANARPPAMRRAPPTTTRANLPGFLHFSDWAGRISTQSEPSVLQRPLGHTPTPVAQEYVIQRGQAHPCAGYCLESRRSAGVRPLLVVEATLGHGWAAAPANAHGFRDNSAASGYRNRCFACVCALFLECGEFGRGGSAPNPHTIHSQQQPHYSRHTA
jgi:hypothetical protein